MVEDIKAMGLKASAHIAGFDHVYEPPREYVEERERKMASKMIKTID